MGKRPSFQFYPGDWRRDTALQSCSLLARGLWHELLCLMHEGEPYGHLALAGKPLTHDQIARMVGESPTRFRAALAELENAGVPSRTQDGVLYSRRMVRDERLRELRAQGGGLGADHGRRGGRPKKQTEGVSKNPLPAAEGVFKEPLEGQQKNPPAVCSLQSAVREPSVLSSKPPGFDLTAPGDATEPPEPETPQLAAQKSALSRLWRHYLDVTGRDARVLTFTGLRRQKGLARLRECAAKTGGDMGRAEALMALAIDRLAASDWHMGRDPKTGGKRYCEWESHLFPNAEKLERWLEDRQ